jgi:FKBP-type peptidyl-prolyl cis-trans isomerase
MDKKVLTAVTHSPKPAQKRRVYRRQTHRQTDGQTDSNYSRESKKKQSSKRTYSVLGVQVRKPGKYKSVSGVTVVILRVTGNK